MIKVFRLLAICGLSIAFSSVAWAQTYQSIDYPGSCLGTTVLAGGPDPQGTSVGSYYDFATCSIFHGFTLTAKGVYTTFDPPGSTYTAPGFISPKGVIVGQYLDSANVSHGFILDGAKYTVIDAPGAAGTVLTGISPFGEISGFSCSKADCGVFFSGNLTYSFVISKKGDYTFFDPPGAISSSTSTVSPSGTVVGNYSDTVGELRHGYLLKNGKYTTIDFPGALYGTFAGGGNFQNDIVGIYNFRMICPADCNHAFLLHNGVFTSFDYPSATVSSTIGTGISPTGVIVGVYTDSSGTHGFIRTP
jgi:hypothetical protein